MNGIEKAKANALAVVARFPEAKTVQEAYDLAVEAGMFKDKHEALSTWGRLNRLLPQAVN